MAAILFVSPYQKELTNMIVVIQKRKPSLTVRIAASKERADVLCKEQRFDGIFITPFSIIKLETTLIAIRNIRSLQGTEANVFVTTHKMSIAHDVEQAGCTGVILKRTFKKFLREYLDRLPC